jgi:hypothetical protein
MRVVLSWLGVGIGLALIALSASMNYLLWSAHGTTAEETVLLGCASICLDILKVMLPSFIVLACREFRIPFVTVSSTLFLLLPAGSSTASLGLQR